MPQDILCITAGQRSGSTALRSLISASPQFADLGEIFDTATIDQPESYFGFCRSRRVQITDILSGPDAERLCRDYFGVLRAKAAGKHLLMDVKFNSWGEIRMPWTFLHQEPFFLNQLKWRGARFIFLWREDIAGQVISDRISDRIGKWHNLDPSDASEPFDLDVEKVKMRAMLLCQSESYFYRDLKSYPNVLMLCYEQMFDPGGALKAEVREEVGALMGERYDFPLLGFFRRNAIDKRKLVANYDTLAAAIREIAALYRDPELAALTKAGLR